MLQQFYGDCSPYWELRETSSQLTTNVFVYYYSTFFSRIVGQTTR